MTRAYAVILAPAVWTVHGVVFPDAACEGDRDPARAG